MILIRQWAGLAPSGSLVPEGLEDCVVETTSQEFWLQIKSRKEGTFSKTEVKNIFSRTNEKLTSIKSRTKKKAFVILEQPCSGFKSGNLDKIFDAESEQVLVCPSPGIECMKILISQLDTAEIIAEGILSDLYKLVASASEENASLSFDNRRRISTTEVSHRIFERLEAEDPSAIDLALASRTLETINFNSPIAEASFYLGVKVTPGHVAAGLVFERRIDKENVTNTLRRKRHVLLTGPSGAGKSALLWSSASGLAGEFRWYQITSLATAADANGIVRFIKARRPTEYSPIGLAFDEIGAVSADLWNVLVREIRSLPFVYLLGSIRQEDAPLVLNHADTEFIQVSLNEKLAENVWHKLRSERQSNWDHWREPFEQSDSLMLEYVHILTQGKRLADVIGDQIRQRQREGRNEELAIIRSTAALCSRGGEIQASKLIALLGINSDKASNALSRLIDEHLVRETRPGVMGGMHILRSQALNTASHDQIVHLSTDSLWQGLCAVTNETLPHVVQSLFADRSDEDTATTTFKLSEILKNTQDNGTWVSILTGLGFATLESHVVSFIETMKQHGVQRGQWALASMFSDPEIDIPELTGFEQWQSLRDAVSAFRATPKKDLRRICLDQISQCLIPSSQTLLQANTLLSCLVPISGGEPIRMNISSAFLKNCGQNISEIAALLSTAYLISPEMALQFVDELGGEEILLDKFQSQIPWVKAPIIEPNGEHGRTIRSDLFFVSSKEQPDLNEALCNICEILIAISPRSKAAASDVVTPLGGSIGFGEYNLWAKNMPRQNIPAKVRVAWNAAFRQTLLARSAEDSLTDYTLQMADLVRRTEKVFRFFTEKWINGKRIVNGNSLAEDINEITLAVNALAYAKPDNPTYDMTKPFKGADKDDSLGALLVGTLGNLLRRMIKIPGDENPKGAAAFAGSLSKQARDYSKSVIWRTSATPPLMELIALAERLTCVSNILHELAYDDDIFSIQKIFNLAKKSSPGKAITLVAKRCHFSANQRVEKKLRSLESVLEAKGWSVRCWLRSLDEADSPYWPAVEIAITVNINDFEVGLENVTEVIAFTREYLKDEWRFRVVPVINGFVAATFALYPASPTSLPDSDFARDWSKHIDLPFFSSELIVSFDKALEACFQISSILACRNLEQLHEVEERAFSNAVEMFKDAQKFISEPIDNPLAEHWLLASHYMDKIWTQVMTEFEAIKEGQPLGELLCMGPHSALSGNANDHSIQTGLARIFILQSECMSIVNSTEKDIEVNG